MLLIDIGNTRIKFTKNSTPFQVQHSQHNELQAIFAYIQSNKIRQILITNGRSDNAKNALRHILHYADKEQIDTHVVAVQPEQLAINYDDPTQFGPDRFLNLLAAKIDYDKNFCVISCGTAITLDFYSNQHIGGMITLGIGATREALAAKTQLTSIDKPTNLLGNTTATVIGSGIYFGYQNLIYGSIKAIEEQENLLFNKVFTGGDSRLICKEKDTIRPHLLFEGMQRYLQMNKIQ